MKNRIIVLGGGCFWCTEAVFSMIAGVVKVTSGYAGGPEENPTYEEVCTGETGHAEVVEIEYDPGKVKLEKILEIFFETHDPTSLDRQGNDTGTQYRSIILYTTEEQREGIEEFIRKIQGRYNGRIVTEVKKLQSFYPAEPYHQRYFEKNPDKAYCMVVISPKVEKVKRGLKTDS
jgi:peptide-methionine (S)-S-oxide reductase